jgi:hypothetical protein
MTVRANKPAFSIREKLKELDYSHVPYDKMPDGVAIQTVIEQYRISGATNEHETSSSSYQPTYFKVTISPKFANSIIEVKAAPNHKENGATAYHNIAVYRSIDGGDYSYIGDGNSNGNVRIAWGSSMSGGLIYGVIPILVYDTPNTTSPVTYKLYHRHSSGSYTVRLGENGADEFMSATEIKSSSSSITKL